MKVKLKKLEDQVIVITGASSGIGLTTARMAAAQGARLVLAARSEGALRQLTDEIRHNGGEAVYVAADVSKQDDVRNIGRVAQEAFGGFDTWVNDAGVGMYGKVEDTPVEDMRRLFETNFWGVVYGSLEAIKHLKREGGALINLGSVESDRVVSLQGVYATTKHAVKAFTDGLRMDLEREGAPVSVTLIKPSAIDTPFPINAKNYLDRAPTLPPPIYVPETVAKAILHVAETPTRDLIVGGGGKGIAALGNRAPGLVDKVMESTAFINMQKKDQPPRPRAASALDRPSENLQARGDYEGHVNETSAYTEAKMAEGQASPLVTGAIVLGAGLALVALLRRHETSDGRHDTRRGAWS